MPIHTDNNQTSQDPDLAWRRLTLKLSHSPDDLKHHIQRILFCLDNNLSEFSAGALQDLFITLQDKGVELRMRMFNLVSPLLDYSERAVFQKVLDNVDDLDNVETPIECQVFKGSVLALSNCPDNDASEGYLPSMVAFQNKHEEAQYLIASGKLVEARSLLERLFLDNEDKSIEEELQSYYFYAKDKLALDEFMLVMSQKGKNISSAWLALRKSSKMW